MNALAPFGWNPFACLSDITEFCGPSLDNWTLWRIRQLRESGMEFQSALAQAKSERH